ncbi:hypothetical protein [Burkholderia phage BCSR5]|nr:hypothetical protein [Burkholderia phage BCSR5]
MQEQIKSNDDPIEAVYTPPPISGYRKLTQSDVDLMNENKGLGEGVRYQLTKVRAHIAAREQQRLENKEAPQSTVTSSEAAVDEAMRHFQTAFMWLNRAVAAPTTLA